MADGFVAGQAKAADDVMSGTDEAFLSDDVQAGSVRQLSATSSQPDLARFSLKTRPAWCLGLLL
jgi:hypothetical protein